MAKSSYLFSLEDSPRKRYENKIKNYGGYPYTFNYKENSLPINVSYYDIFSYLVNKKSAYTGQMFKAKKSLDAFKMFEGGWVSELKGKKLTSGLHIVYGRVKHTQRLNMGDLKIWVSVTENGEIETAHCNCVAGLSECCSHVGAVLFALESIFEQCQRVEIACVTDVGAYWKKPNCKTVLYREAEKIWPTGSDCSIEKLPQFSEYEAIDLLKQLKENNINVVNETTK